MTIHRKVFVFDRVEKGWTPQNAALVAWTIHPFNSDLQPRRRLEKEVRWLVKSFVKAHGRTTDQFECAEVARDTLQTFVYMAEQYNDPYALIWADVLEGTSGSELSSDSQAGTEGSELDDFDDETEPALEPVRRASRTSAIQYITVVQIPDGRLDELTDLDSTIETAVGYLTSQIFTVATMTSIEDFASEVSDLDPSEVVVLEYLCYQASLRGYLIGLESLEIHPSDISDPAAGGRFSSALVRLHLDRTTIDSTIPLVFSPTTKGALERILDQLDGAISSRIDFGDDEFDLFQEVIIDAFGFGLSLAHTQAEMEKRS